MKTMCRLIVVLIFVLLNNAYAETPLPEQKEYLPESGKGRVLIVVSGSTGLYHYQPLAKHFAKDYDIFQVQA